MMRIGELLQMIRNELKMGNLIRIAASIALLTSSCSVASSPATSHRLDLEAWRPLTTSYVPLVRSGNTVAFPAEARVPFAHYIVAIHQRLHPIFEEELKAAREAYPVLRDSGDLLALVELVLEGDDGRIASLGVVRPSGVLVFDTVALVTLRRAAPFGRPPPSIVSSDGKAYLHWDLHTDPHDSCSPRNARPYLLADLP